MGVKGYAIHLSFPPGNAVLMRDKAQKRHNTEGGDTIADYIRADTTLPAYLPYPRFLLKMEISQTAKLLYALLLDRSTLSQKNGWQDGEGRIFIVYPVAEIAEMLDKGCTAIKGALKELDAAGLLERERRGFSAPNRLYVKVPPVPVVRFSDQLMAGKATLIQSEKRPYDGRKTDPMMVGKPTPNKTIIFEGPAEDRNMNTLVDMISGMEVKEDDEDFTKSNVESTPPSRVHGRNDSSGSALWGQGTARKN